MTESAVLEVDPTLTADPQQAKRAAKLKYLREYQKRQRELLRVSAEERPILLVNPSLSPEVCRICWLKTDKLSNHLRTAHVKELSNGSVDADCHSRIQEYKRRFGYDKNAALISASLLHRHSEATNGIIRRRRQQGRAPFGQKTRFRRRHSPTAAATLARKHWGTSKQARQKMSASRRGRALPAKRKKSSMGQTVTDWQIAKLRLEGKEKGQIAEKVQPPLTYETIWARLDRIGFPPGKRCRFFRGEPVTEKLLLAHFEDLKYIRVFREVTFRADKNGDSPLTRAQIAALLNTPESWVLDQTRPGRKNPMPHFKEGRYLMFRPNEVLKWCAERKIGRSRFFSTRHVEEELASRLGVGRHRVYDFVRPGGQRHPRDSSIPRTPNHPISWDLGGALLSSIASLRQQYRQLGATAKGGRPKALLPSEEKELPGKYQALKADLDLMLRWAELEKATVTLKKLGEWMCEQARFRKLQVLLFWPSLHSRLPEICEQARNRVRGGIASPERTKELLSGEYQISHAQLDRVIFSTVSAALPTSKA